MCVCERERDERKRNMLTNKQRKKKSNKISKIFVKLFNIYFILKSMIKFIEILKKQFIKIYIFLILKHFL